MTLPLDAAAIDARRALARGPLAPLAASLGAELDRAMAAAPEPAPVKARMTRAGGRCARDGALLGFDPYEPRVHRCPRCAAAYEGDEHWRWWIMWYQLWLAERAVHAAALHLLLGHPRHAAFAAHVLDAFADRYLGYPNEDNVLGPGRPFFSTYLESVWLLQLCVALDLLEAAAAPDVRALGGRVRDRLVAPSRAIVAGFPEGRSNRQVWNGAALLAAARTLGDVDAIDALVHGRDGLVAQLSGSLLADGTWYEGENYHQFAHRGLWYAVTLAEGGGVELPAPLVARFRDGFAAPLLTALPDLTLPARRDSQWAISLRQWRWAETFELGLARGDDPRLAAALARLYGDAVPRGDTGRWRAAAEAERNEPPTSLSRADLGWRSLLHARAGLPDAGDWSPSTVLLPAQGIAVFRRDRGRLYAALDYGESGGGHGHPDRLNVLLADGDARWLDDAGTGSYVERTLHWYRSTLAHNAPLVDGRSQRRTDGRLLAFVERDDAGWALAEAEIAPGVVARRALVVLDDLVIDDLRWSTDRDVEVDLPMHVDGEPEGLGPWRHDSPGGAGGLEDGFDFMRDARACDAPAARTVLVHVAAPRGAAGAGAAWVHADSATTWWRAVAPGAPGEGERAFLFVRMRGRRGHVRTVWDPRRVVREVHVFGELLTVRGDRAVAALLAAGDEWRLTRAGRAPLVLRVSPRPAEPDAAVATRGAEAPAPEPARIELVAGGPPVELTLGEAHYRRTERPWADAGSPRAEVRLAVESSPDGPRLAIDARVKKADPLAFSPARENDLDNEHADVNSDGLQLHLRRPSDDATLTWLLVPEPEGRGVRITPRAPGADALAPDARWEPIADGWRIRCTVPLAPLLPSPPAPAELRFALAVNERPPWRERRRGQLVLGGDAPGFAYLQGDRLPHERFAVLELRGR